MNENKQNTTLLTVIAVATLLVAVVGSTFAYFTAQNNQGSTSQITVTGGTMTIEYGDGTATLTKGQGTDIDGKFLPSMTPVFTKTFTITGNNTTALAMPFTVKLQYNTNLEFAGALAYKLTVPSVAGLNVTPNNTNLVNNADAYNNGYNTLAVVGAGAGASDFTHILASGSFNGNTTNIAGTFSLEVYYLEAGVNQDADKNKSFTGHIEVTGDNAHTYGSNAGLIG